ncbi:helix-turn-helix domain-containing protein (plasmid) [Streptomyces sp. NBC_01220]|uniref:helix-turn-helix domain-containing protein n=1 Tax=Streptomyces sp. NBC_01220 TaxID=2903781 RepID=UPI00352DA812|nr:helix-turn-helix domain-containing protein [Streptomyces sp. NBC_01220]
MTISHVGQALDTPADISATERLVLVLLAQHADADGTASPSISWLAQRANISPSTAARALQRLTDAGLIQQVRLSTTAGTSAGWLIQLIGDNAVGARA